MPSFADYKRILGSKTHGQVRKIESDHIMEATWDDDISSRIGYIYSQEYDDQFESADDLHPEESETKIPVEIKFYEIEYNSLSKDEVGQHVIFKPSYKYQDSIVYYDNLFKNNLGATFPDGLYIDIPDSEGIYHRYLFVDHYRRDSNQFPSFIVLPCNHKLQWIYDDTKLESWCVLRSQNSYNSGVWLDNKFQSVENQKITWLPYNDKTKTIFYDQRVAITQEREIPICWSCTKVEDMNVKGIIRVTWKQGKYDEHLDYIERDENGKIIGTWCDYYKNGIEPKEPEPTPENIYSKVTCNGNSSLMVINGSPKRFTVKFYDGDEEIEVQSGEWKFEIESVDVSDEIEVVELQDNNIKVKFIGDIFYIGKNLAVKYVSDSGIESELVLELSGL